MKLKSPISPAAILLSSLALASFTLQCSLPADARVVGRMMRQGPVAEPSPPVLAVVGLAEQRVTIYDANGKILQSSVSSGQTGLDTPAGVYSVVQKEEEHTSNVYDDASMPFMARITWTGIALHAGDLPGYPASHGCVRMPEDFARELYGLTSLGLRVVIAREDIAPVGIAGPAFFTPISPRSTDAEMPAPRPTAMTTGPGGYGAAPASENARMLIGLRRTASLRVSEANVATAKEKEARQAASRAAADGARATQAVKQAESNLAKAEADLRSAEKAIEAGGSQSKLEKAERAKQQAMANIEARRAQLQSVQAQSQAKLDAVRVAEEAASAAAAAATAANEAWDEAKQNMSPVSVFISRKTQRLYIRKANMPIYETPVVIRDHDQTIGTFVFTALGYDSANANAVRWNVVSLFEDPTHVEPPQPAGKRKVAKNSPPHETNAAAAQAALDRLTVSDEARERISDVVLPGSSLIISDEAQSIETGKDTDFVVIMSGEPQGGIAIRHHPVADRDRDRDRDRQVSWDDDGGSRGRRGRRSGGGGGGNGFLSWFD